MAYALSAGSVSYGLARLLSAQDTDLSGDAAWPRRAKKILGAGGYDAQEVRHDPREAALLTEPQAPALTLTREVGSGWVAWVVEPLPGGLVRAWRVVDRATARFDWTPAQLHQALGAPTTPMTWLRVRPMLLLAPLGLEPGERGGDPYGRALARLGRLMACEKSDLGWIFLYAVVVGALSLTVPAAVQALVSLVAFSVLLQPLLVLTALVGVALTYSGVLRCLQVHVVEHLQRRLFVRVASDMMRRVVGGGHGGDAAHLVSHKFFEVATLQKAAASLLIGGLDAVLQVALSIVILAFYHPWLLAIDALLLAGLGVVLFGMGRRAVRFGLEESHAKYAVAGHIERLAEHRGGATVGACEEQVEEYLQARGRRFRVVFAQHIGCAIIGVSVSVVLLGAGGWLVLRQELSLGQLVAAELIVAAVAAGAAKMSRYLDTFYDLLVATEKLGRWIDDSEAGAEAAVARDLPVPRWPLSLPPASVGATRTARTTLWLMPISLVLLFLVPWQQTARGEGRVIAFAPAEREQPIESPVDGRVLAWSVREGGHVEAGQVLVEVVDNDPQYALRLAAEQASLEEQIALGAAATRSAEANIAAMEAARTKTLEAAEARVVAAVHRHKSAERALDAALAGLHAAGLNQRRQQALSGQGLVSARAHELAEQALAGATGEVEKGRAAVAGATADVAALRAEALRAAAGADADIARARAAGQAARGQESRLKIEHIKLQTRRGRQAAMTISAPRPGTVLAITSWPGSGVVKAGDRLATFVPDALTEAVELWVDGLDAPFMEAGRSVRLQFEGWPAVQFSGWPVVAVGTFPGEIAFVDASVYADGRQRFVVTPAPGSDWPAAHYLRQGVRAHGWVRLDTVTLGYELWRKLNDFPIAPKGTMYRRHADRDAPPKKGGAADKEEPEGDG